VADRKLATASHYLFLGLMVALPWSIAPMSIAAVLCAAATLLVWALAGVPLGTPPSTERWTRTPADLPALAWIAALVLASVFAVDPAASWPRVVKGLLLVLVPVAAYHARDEAFARRAVAILLASACAAALFALVKFGVQGPAFPNRVKGAVNHPLTYGGQALLFAALASAIAIRGRGLWRVGALASLACLLPALAGTYTRSAWIGYVVALGVVIAFTRARWLAVLGAALVPLTFLLQGTYRARALSIFDPSSPWNRERLHMWEAGARMWRDHPWTGVGLQDLHALYDRYRSAAAMEPAGHLHSVYVHVAATMGVFGLAALAVLIAGLLTASWRGFRESRSDFGTALALGVLAGLIGFFVAGFFEWNLGDEELLDLLYTLVGIAFAARVWTLNLSARARAAGESSAPDLPAPPAEEAVASLHA